MSKQKHTPGPWTTDGSMVRAHGWAVCQLTDLDDESEDGEYGDGKRALLAARSAIAKAKGGSQ